MSALVPEHAKNLGHGGHLGNGVAAEVQCRETM